MTNLKQTLCRTTRSIGGEMVYNDHGRAHTEKRARERALMILKEQQPAPLPEDVSKALDDLVNDALRQLNP